jgi:hypothetical protein
MASINLSTILHDVRVILDQNAEGYDVAGVGEYTLEMDDVIRQQIIPAVQWAHMNAPLGRLHGANMSATVSGGKVALPADFMRLVSLKLANWQRAVNTFITEDDPQVSVILSDYAGLRPTANKPVVVFREEGGTSYLMPYPADAGAVTASYIPRPQITGSGDAQAVDIEPAVYQAFLYYLAHLVKLTYNEDNKYAEQAQAML